MKVLFLIFLSARVIKDRPDSDKTAPPAAAAAAATQTAVATPTILEDWPQDFPEYLKTEIEEWKQVHKDWQSWIIPRVHLFLS